MNGVDENLFRQTWIRKAFRFGLPAQNPGISQTSWHRRAPGHGRHLVFTRDSGAGRQEWTVLGKPASAREARLMIEHLSGRCHKVITGVYLRSGGDPAISEGFEDSTLVWFSGLSGQEIDII